MEDVCSKKRPCEKCVCAFLLSQVFSEPVLLLCPFNFHLPIWITFKNRWVLWCGQLWHLHMGQGILSAISIISVIKTPRNSSANTFCKLALIQFIYLTLLNSTVWHLRPSIIWLPWADCLQTCPLLCYTVSYQVLVYFLLRACSYFTNHGLNSVPSNPCAKAPSLS